MIALPPSDFGRSMRIQVLLLVMAVTLNIASFVSVRAVVVPHTSVRPAHQTAALPVRVRIASINVDAPIVMLGLRKDGVMDIPATSYQVGWFEPGFIPGQQGNAVFAGHLDTVSGEQAVFWNLRRLRMGDLIDVEMNDGTFHHFRVRTRATYPMSDAPMRTIFGSSTGSHLNLVTCHGQWNDTIQSYESRLVVYTDEVF